MVIHCGRLGVAPLAPSKTMHNHRQQRPEGVFPSRPFASTCGADQSSCGTSGTSCLSGAIFGRRVTKHPPFVGMITSKLWASYSFWVPSRIMVASGCGLWGGFPCALITFYQSVFKQSTTCFHYFFHTQFANPDLCFCGTSRMLYAIRHRWVSTAPLWMDRQGEHCSTVDGSPG